MMDDMTPPQVIVGIETPTENYHNIYTRYRRKGESMTYSGVKYWFWKRVEGPFFSQFTGNFKTIAFEVSTSQPNKVLRYVRQILQWLSG